MSRGFLGRLRKQQTWLSANFHQYQSICFQVPLCITRHLNSSDVVGIHHHLISSGFPEGGTSAALDPARPLGKKSKPVTAEGKELKYRRGGQARAVGNTITENQWPWWSHSNSAALSLSRTPSLPLPSSYAAAQHLPLPHGTHKIAVLHILMSGKSQFVYSYCSVMCLWGNSLTESEIEM